MNNCEHCEIKKEIDLNQQDILKLLRANCYLCRRQPAYEFRNVGDLSDKFIRYAEYDEEDYPGGLAFSI
jgi:hypothetical protein